MGYRARSRRLSWATDMAGAHSFAPDRDARVDRPAWAALQPRLPMALSGCRVIELSILISILCSPAILTVSYPRTSSKSYRLHLTQARLMPVSPPALGRAGHG